MKEQTKVLEVKKIKEPKQMEIFEISFLEEGKLKKKEVAKSANVVKILIYHKEKNAFVLVKQFRPLVYLKYPEYAVRYELCGGREDDKEGLTSEEIAKEEVLEETGYRVKEIQKITTLFTGGKMTLYYTEVDESMRETKGGGLDYETIDVFYLPVNEAEKFMFDETIPKRPGLMFAFCWFFNMRKQAIFSSSQKS